MKTCSKCKTEKPRSEFYKDASKRCGLRSSCKACISIAITHSKPRDREKKKLANAAWQKANREKAKAYSAKWYAANRESHKAMKAAWYAANPDAVRIHSHNRRAREREAGGTLSAGLAERLFKLQRGKCACGCKQPLGDDYHMDHRMPVALGGANEDWNIQLLTAKCNMQKQAKHPIDFMRERGFLL